MDSVKFQDEPVNLHSKLQQEVKLMHQVVRQEIDAANIHQIQILELLVSILSNDHLNLSDGFIKAQIEQNGLNMPR